MLMYLVRMPQQKEPPRSSRSSPSSSADVGQPHSGRGAVGRVVLSPSSSSGPWCGCDPARYPLLSAPCLWLGMQEASSAPWGGGARWGGSILHFQREEMGGLGEVRSMPRTSSIPWGDGRHRDHAQPLQDVDLSHHVTGMGQHHAVGLRLPQVLGPLWGDGAERGAPSSSCGVGRGQEGACEVGCGLSVLLDGGSLASRSTPWHGGPAGDRPW